MDTHQESLPMNVEMDGAMTDKKNPEVLDEHRNIISVDTNDKNGQVNLAFENHPADKDNPINDNYYNSEQHEQALKTASNGNEKSLAEIDIPSDSLINMHNGRVKNKNKKPKEKETEKIPLEDMNQEEKANGADNTNGHKNGIPISSDHLTPYKHENSLGKPFKEYFIPVTTHKKFLRGEKLYLQKYKGKSSGWKKCIICGIVFTFVAIAILIAILLATGLIVLKSDERKMESKRNNSIGVQPAAARDRNTGDIIFPVEDPVVTIPPEVTDTTPPLLILNETTTDRYFEPTSISPESMTEDVTPIFYEDITDNEFFNPSPIVAEITSTSEAPRTRLIEDEDPNALSGNIRLTSLKFDDQLTNNSSPEYQNLAQSVQDEILTALSKKDGRRVKSVKILGFSPGSVNVHYVIVYEDEKDNTIENDPEETARSLNNYITENGGAVAGHEVDLSSIRIKRVHNECLENNGLCSHFCLWDSETLIKTCSCQEGYNLDVDERSCLEELSTESIEENDVGYMESHMTTSEPTSEPEPSSYNQTDAYAEPTSEPEPSSYNQTDVYAEPTSEPEPSSYNQIDVYAEPTSEPEPSSYNQTDVYAEPTSEPEPSSYNETDVYAEPTSEPEPSSYNETDVYAKPTSEPEPSSYNQTELYAEPTSEPEPSSYNATEIIAEPTTEPEMYAYNETEPTSEPEPSAYNGTEIYTEPTSEPEMVVYNGTEINEEPTSEPEPSSYNQTEVYAEPELNLYNETEPTSYNVTEIQVEPELVVYNETDDYMEPTTETELMAYNETAEPELASYNATDIEPTSEPESTSYNETEVTGLVSMNETEIYPIPSNDTEVIAEPSSEPEPAYNETKDYIDLFNETESTNNTTYNTTELFADPTNEPEPMAYNQTDEMVLMESNFTQEIYDFNNTEPTNEPELYLVNATDIYEEYNVTEPTSYNFTELYEDETSYNEANMTLEDVPVASNSSTNETVVDMEFRNQTEVSTDNTTSNNSIDGSSLEATQSIIDYLVSCNFDQYACIKPGIKNVSCIPNDLRCDGIFDCEDGSDEKDCGNCTIGTFPCKDNSYCLSPNEICDNKLKCLDGSDERSCSTQSACTDRGGVSCSNGLCLPSALKCNGVIDCPSGEDEATCGCSEDEFKCADSSCISMEKRCNSEWDCDDNSDEMNCVKIDPDTSILRTYAPGSGWIPMCDQDWTIKDGHSACQNLGYNHAIHSESVPMLENITNWSIKQNADILPTFIHFNVTKSNICSSNHAVTVRCNTLACTNDELEGPNWDSLVILSDDDSENSTCVGMAISPMWVLTTKTCLDERKWKPDSSWSVQSVSNPGDLVQKKKQISKFFVHPNANYWRSRNLFQDNDLVLAMLDKPFDIVDNQQTECLVKAPVTNSSVCHSAFILTNGSVSSKLMKNVDAECNGTDHYDGRITNTMICATHTTDENTCNPGDVLVMMCKENDQWKVSGLQSYVRHCNLYKEHPRVYSNVSSMLGFVRSILGSVFDFGKTNEMLELDARSEYNDIGNQTESVEDIQNVPLSVYNDTENETEVTTAIYELENLNATSMLDNSSSIGSDFEDVTEILNATNTQYQNDNMTGGNGCDKDSFRCEFMTDSCIPNKLLCDGKEDCMDGSDESSCLRLHPEATVLEGRKTGQGIDSEFHPRDLWMPMCSDRWNDKLSESVCHQMGMSGLNYVEYSSSSSLKLNRPAQKFMALKESTNLSQAINVHSLLEETDDCETGNYILMSCSTERCGAWSLDLQPIGRAVGGNPAQDGQWPSVTIIKSKLNDSSICTGSVVHRKWVLTAASCIERTSSDPKSWVFQSGPNDPTMKIDKIVFHPQKLFGNLTHYDLAMLELSEFIDKNSQVHTVCPTTRPLEDRQLCVTASWMRNPDTGELTMKYLPVPVVPMFECNGSKYYDGRVSDEMVCAGFTDRPRTSCQGDEGAPLMCVNSNEVWDLHGTLLQDNTNKNCEELNHPSIYTGIYTQSHWIQRLTSYTNINSISSS